MRQIISILLSIGFVAGQDIIIIKRRVAAAGGSAPVYQSSNSAVYASGTGVSFTATTCTGSNKVMLFAVAMNNGSAASTLSATYNGADISSSLMNSGFVNYTQVFVWLVVNPASAATFTATVDTNDTSRVAISACYTGVNQSTPNRTAVVGTGLTTPGTLDVTNSQANDLIVGFFGLNDTTNANGMTSARVGAGQSYRLQITNTDEWDALSLSDEAGASGTVTHSWTFVNNADNGWAGVAFALIPA